MTNNINKRSAQPVKAGCAKCEITVNIGDPLIGYEVAKRKAQGIHDPLYAKAAVVETDGRRFAVVCCDLLGVDECMSQSLAARAARLGIKPEDFFLCATHTHSAPGGYFTVPKQLGRLLEISFKKAVPEKVSRVENAVMGALELAVKQLRDAQVFFNAVPSGGIGTDRNNKEVVGDPTVSVFRFAFGDGGGFLLHSSACHPTILHEDNKLVSADYPGACSDILKADGFGETVFLNGSAGDVSTRYTRQSGGFDEVARQGGLLAAQVEAAAKSARDVSDAFTADSGKFEIELKIRGGDLAGDLRRLVSYGTKARRAKKSGLAPDRVREIKAKAEGAQLGLLYSLFCPKVKTAFVSVRFLRLGGAVLMFVPAEVFSALTNPLREKFGGRVIPVGYANGYFGYLPDPSVESTENYEKYTCAFCYSEGQRLVEAAEEFIAENYGKYLV